VRYDNRQKDAFIVTRDNGSEMEFIPSREGLYHYDFTLSIERRKEMERNRVMMIKTVEEIKRNFTKKEIEKADEARRLFVIIGRPSQKIFKEMIKRGKLINNTVMIQDYRNALEIYGEDLGVLKGKTVRSKPEVLKVQFTDKPEPKNIVLSIDKMYFMGIYFLTTVSRNIGFITATMLPDRKKVTIYKALQ
jgi:hypothetical protein